jgi:predicted TIM-barrel fold metal-dependent hydrolase
MDDLLLRDFAPQSTLELDEHIVERPKFPVIDAHNHDMFWNEDLGIPDVPTLVDLLDECGVRAIVNLDGGWGAHLEAQLDKYDRAYPGRFYTFANVDWSALDEPGFGEKMAAQLERSVAQGARGLKIYKTLGLELADKSGKLVAPDDERWDPIWAKAGELGIPVMIHLGDVRCFFQPLDRFNEGYMALQECPDLHYYGPQFPDFRYFIDSGIRLISRHPNTTFVAAHTGWYSENLRFVGEQMLDELPNLYVDFSARICFLGRQPHSARRFLTRYQDRVLFGTDEILSADVYRTHFRWLETADDYFEVKFGLPWVTRRIYGVHLPDDVLAKIYYKNAEGLIPGIV